MVPLTWSQFGLAGLIAISLGTAIVYIFKLLLETQKQAVKDAQAERDSEHVEVARLHKIREDTQREALMVLADVARVMSEVQQMLREREMQLAMEREFSRRKESERGGQSG